MRKRTVRVNLSGTAIIIPIITVSSKSLRRFFRVGKDREHFSRKALVVLAQKRAFLEKYSRAARD